MFDEAAASLLPLSGQDLSASGRTLFARFANPALPHRLAQIAADGSQEIPQRWLEPLAVNAGRGRRSPATLQALAAWVVHVRGGSFTVVDPMADDLRRVWAAAGADRTGEALFGEGGLIGSSWRPDREEQALLTSMVKRLDPS